MNGRDKKICAVIFVVGVSVMGIVALVSAAYNAGVRKDVRYDELIMQLKCGESEDEMVSAYHEICVDYVVLRDAAQMDAVRQG